MQLTNEDIVAVCHDRARKPFTRESIQVLETMYIEDNVSSFNKPKVERIIELATVTGKTEKRLLKWFGNKVCRENKPYKPKEKVLKYTGPTLLQSRLEAADTDGTSLVPVETPLACRR